MWRDKEPQVNGAAVWTVWIAIIILAIAIWLLANALFRGESWSFVAAPIVAMVGAAGIDGREW